MDVTILVKVTGMDPEVLDQMITRIAEQLAEKLGAKGATLDKRLAFVRRQLPKRARHAGVALLDAQRMAQAPQLAMKIDAGQVEAAHRVLDQFLTEFDAEAALSRKRYNRWSTIAAQFLLVCAVMLGLLWWVDLI